MLSRKIKTKFKIDNLNEKIFKYNTKLPIGFIEIKNINTNSWFNIKETLAIDELKPIKNDSFINSNEKIIKTLKININFNKKQKLIMDKWFDGYTKMYNETIKYIRTKYEFTRHNILNKIIDIKNFSFYSLRSKMTSIKDKIHKKNNIFVHVLDRSIKLVASNIKSANSNIKNGNIKRYRLRYLNYNRNSQTIEIEKTYITKNKLCPKIFGDIKYSYNNKDYKLNSIEHDVKINYNKMTNKYTLLIPISENIKIKEKSNESIGLDPGLRVFMTGVSEKRTVNIGENVNNIIKNQIERLNKIKNNENIPKIIKKKNELLINRKIENKIDDMQWKTIKYLTTNYDSIYLGDMSSQSIVKKESSILSKFQKVACLRTRYYMFQIRLKNKCTERGVHFKLVNEYLTSKTCSICTTVNENLNEKKQFNCENCYAEMDRDINGARNIYFKGI